MKPRHRIWDAVVLGLLGIYAIPYAWQVLTSVKPEAELLRLPPLLPTRFTLEHYQVVFAQSALPRALGNSLAVAVMSTVLVVIARSCSPPTPSPGCPCRPRAGSCSA